MSAKSIFVLFEVSSSINGKGIILGKSRKFNVVGNVVQSENTRVHEHLQRKKKKCLYPTGQTVFAKYLGCKPCQIYLVFSQIYRLSHSKPNLKFC